MKIIIQNIKDNYKLVTGVLLIGLFIGWIISPSESNNKASDSHAEHTHEQEKPSVWTCSMHPQIKQDKPGLCPICAMDLIPLTTMNTTMDADPNEIVMSEAAAKLAEIQTTIVTKGTPLKAIYLQGKIHVDERRIAELTARFGGRIEKLNINFTGQHVRKGQTLATIYSPALITTQRELIEAYKVKDSKPSLYKATRAKLKAWNIPDKKINAIETSGEPMVNFDILSPITGTVMMRQVALGDYVKEGTALFKVVDLTKVWALFDAYETDLPWIKTGDKVQFTLPALPGESFEARVSFVDPVIDAQTRVAKVRVEVNNADLRIKPEMFTNAVLESKIAKELKAVLIPKTAVLWTGKRAVVYIKVKDRESPSFLYREIILGPEAGAHYVVKEGLTGGEEVASNGVFKIDAAAQLAGLPSMMNAPDKKHEEQTSFTVAGNCEMCKNRIEKAALSIFGVSNAIWLADKQTLSVKYNSEKTGTDVIQKAVATSGHDTEKYKASDEVYKNLPNCCQYERLDIVTTKKHTGEHLQELHAMFTVAGNCGMCKERIEKAALSVLGVSKANWDADKQVIHVNFSNQTTEDTIKKAIATAGHDTEKYKASDEVYNNLPNCCQYERLDIVTTKKHTEEHLQELHATFTVAGNCGMCKKRIEKAALSVQGVSKANWDADKQVIHVNFSNQTMEDAIKKAIATAGHDTEKYKASDEVYNNLHGCCQYKRL